MKNIILYSLIILCLCPAWSEDGLQLFGSRRDAEKEKSNNQSSFSQDNEVEQDFPLQKFLQKKY